MNNFLTLDLLKGLVGKTIEWKAPAYRGNNPYGGVTKINTIDLSQRRPIISEEVISGDKLVYAFVDDHTLTPTEGGYKFALANGQNNCLSYSDRDREVTYVDMSELETALIPFFKEHHTSSHSFMHVEIYGNKEREEKSNIDLQNALKEQNLVNPYSSLNELREQAILWHCVDTTERLIADGKSIDPDMNPTEWRKF